MDLQLNLAVSVVTVFSRLHKMVATDCNGEKNGVPFTTHSRSAPLSCTIDVDVV